MDNTPVDAIRPEAIEIGQIYADHHSEGEYILSCHEKLVRYANKSLAAQDGLDWKEQHENLLAVRQQDIAALQSKIESLEAQLKFKNEAINLTKGCPGKVVIRDGFYVLDCYKKKLRKALSAKGS